MASKNSSKSYDNFEIEEEFELDFMKLVQLNYPGIVKVLAPSGITYVWEKGGEILLIENKEDFEYIISKELPKSCCGSRKQQFMFLEINSEVLL